MFSGEKEYSLVPLVLLDEEERLKILYSYGILDSPLSSAFGRTCALAARITDMPIALVSLISRDEQIHKACFGMTASRTPRDEAFCAYTILEKEAFIVKDARKDPRFTRNPGVVGAPGIVFYAGIPLMNKDGSGIGSLCVIDREPRELTATQIQNLKDLAELVEDEIRLHLKTKQAREAEAHYARLYDNVNESLNNLRKDLTRRVSHELRTPLSGIVGLTDCLRDEWKEISEAEVEELFNSIEKSGERLERLIQNICDLTQLEVLHSDQQPDVENSVVESFAITATVESVVRDELKSMETDVQLDMEIEDYEINNLPKWYFRRALAEIINNALKFSRSDGVVSIRGSVEESAYMLRISNQGMDMSERDIEQIGAFMQFDRDKYEQQGMGLGLELTRAIAQRFGFTIELRRTDGSAIGAEFCIPT